MRLFVGSPLPEPVVRDLDAAIGPLRSRHAEVRWSRPATWHVTLAFVGNVRDSDAGKVAVALDEAVVPRAFEAALGPLGAFPDTKHPKVVWVGLSVGAFPELAEAVRQALAAKAVPFDPKPFRPHVTVGRVPAGRRPKGFAATCASWESPRTAWRVESYVLYKSDLLPDGVIHSPIKRYALPD